MIGLLGNAPCVFLITFGHQIKKKTSLKLQYFFYETVVRIRYDIDLVGLWIQYFVAFIPKMILITKEYAQRFKKHNCSVVCTLVDIRGNRQSASKIFYSFISMRRFNYSIYKNDADELETSLIYNKRVTG